jgi:hypothetical protein
VPGQLAPHRAGQLTDRGAVWRDGETGLILELQSAGDVITVELVASRTRELPGANTLLEEPLELPAGSGVYRVVRWGQPAVTYRIAIVEAGTKIVVIEVSGFDHDQFMRIASSLRTF